MTSAKHFDSMQGIVFSKFLKKMAGHLHAVVSFIAACQLYEISEVTVDLLNCAEKVSSKNLDCLCS